LTASIAKKMGIKQVICRAQTAVHAEIFRRIGADEIIQPESQAGSELARRLANPHLADCIELAGGYSLVELPAPKAFQGKTLEQIALRSRYQVNLIMIKRLHATTAADTGVRLEKTYVPQPDDIIQPGDILVLVGSDPALAELPRE
jgi:trk system potassium uptake protein TrkA